MYIGIDLGTSGVKSILIDHDQNILSVAYAKLEVDSPKDGYNEQNPYDWINATENCLLQLQKKHVTFFSKCENWNCTAIQFLFVCKYLHNLQKCINMFFA